MKLVCERDEYDDLRQKLFGLCVRGLFLRCRCEFGNFHSPAQTEDFEIMQLQYRWVLG